MLLFQGVDNSLLGAASERKGSGEKVRFEKGDELVLGSGENVYDLQSGVRCPVYHRDLCDASFSVLFLKSTLARVARHGYNLCGSIAWRCVPVVGAVYPQVPRGERGIIAIVGVD